MPTAGEVRGGFHGMRERVGQGIDAMRPSDYADLPDVALEDLGRIWAATEATWAWPTQYLLVLVRLAKKPQGGDRALLCYHLAMRARGRLRKTVVDGWSESWCQWWDQAVRGSSALKAAFARILHDEVHAAMGWSIAAGFADIKGFYGHTLWGKLVQEAIRWHYPLQGVVLSIQAFMAPRMLCWQGWVTEDPILPGRSVGTGIRSGNDLARVYSYSWVEHITQSCVGVTLAQCVDDVPFRAIGTPLTSSKG